MEGSRYTRLAAVPKGTILIPRSTRRNNVAVNIRPAGAAAAAAVVAVPTPNHVALNITAAQPSSETTATPLSLPPAPQQPQPTGAAAAELPTPPAEPNIKSKFVKKGSYGCVVRPALPNRNSASVWHEYPNNITKIYTNSISAEKAQINSRKVLNIMGANEGLAVHPYAYPYQVKNLPANLKTSCGDIGEPNDDLVALRQSDLGMDVADYAKPENISAREQYRRLPISTFLLQVQKLFQQVQNLINNKYIHGDIRETNVLINPKTGILTIIDFDWLYPYETFLSKYPVGTFYSNPPESILYKLYGLIPIDVAPTSPEFTSYLALKDPRSYIQGLVGAGLSPITPYVLLAHLYEDIKYFRTTLGLNKRQFGEYLLKSFDAWGLAFTLLRIITTTWPEIYRTSDIPAELIPIKQVNYVLLRMMAIQYSQRLLFPQALDEINSIVSAVLPAVPPAASKGGQRKKLKHTRSNRKSQRKH